MSAGTVEEYSWKNLKVILAGRSLMNTEEISFKVKQKLRA